MMKTLALVVICCALVSAETKEAAPKQTAKKEAAPAAGAKIPSGAKKVAPFTYSFTDTKGVKWIYRETPFGVVKMEDKPEVAPVPDNSTPTVATDLGDTVQFERKTPFGASKWTKKKSDLTAEEEALIAKPAAGAEKQ